MMNCKYCKYFNELVRIEGYKNCLFYKNTVNPFDICSGCGEGVCTNDKVNKLIEYYDDISENFGCIFFEQKEIQ